MCIRLCTVRALLYDSKWDSTSFYTVWTGNMKLCFWQIRLLEGMLDTLQATSNVVPILAPLLKIILNSCQGASLIHFYSLTHGVYCP